MLMTSLSPATLPTGTSCGSLAQGHDLQVSTYCAHHPAVGNDNGVGDATAIRAYRLDGLDHRIALNHLSEHYVLAVQVRCAARTQEELAPVGVPPAICH